MRASTNRVNLAWRLVVLFWVMAGEIMACTIVRYVIPHVYETIFAEVNTEFDNHFGGVKPPKKMETGKSSCRISVSLTGPGLIFWVTRVKNNQESDQSFERLIDKYFWWGGYIVRNKERRWNGYIVTVAPMPSDTDKKGLTADGVRD